MPTWRALVWLAVLALWTAGLLMPEPQRQAPLALQGSSWTFVIAKLMHLIVYAALALATVWLPGRLTWWLGLLAAHAALGEWLQTWVPTRTGTLTDVAIDLAGIALGGAAAWWWKKSYPRQ